MRQHLALVLAMIVLPDARAGDPPVIADPEAFTTLVNPQCSHCRDESRRRAGDLKPEDRVLAWTRGYSEGGAIPVRFFLAPYRVISDSYGVFVFDPEAGYARGFAPSYDFRFHGWRNGVMVIREKDGTLYSALTGLAFDGPKKGRRLTPVPTLVSNWGFWLEKYPQAVAYHMFEKYQPVSIPERENPGSVRSRGAPDPRLPAPTEVLGVWSGRTARAYPVSRIEQDGFLKDTLDGQPLVLFWEPRTRTAAAYRPVAVQPRKYKAPVPDASGVSPPDAGTLADGTAAVPPRKLAFRLAAAKDAPGGFQDAETGSFWDVAGRCAQGELQGYTLDWVDSVQVKWFAWAAEHPETSIAADAARSSNDEKKTVREIAGTAEFLRLLPKPFVTVKAVDPAAGKVTLLADGETEPRTWSLEPDAELKVGGWWGRLSQFRPGDRAWAWLKLDRKRNPVSVVMLADEISEFDMHGSLRQDASGKPPFTAEAVEARRTEQRAWLRKLWTEEGLPGTLTFLHVFSGELELTLDHEAMRWGRSLAAGDVVQLAADPSIKGVVRSVAPWRERTVVRLVVGELEASDLKIGQRLSLKRTPPPESVDSSLSPPDLGRPRSKPERIDWFLASTYCTCGIDRDICTGHFYTLASCNPNGCGMPNARRKKIGELIDRGLSDQQIFDQLLQEDGPLLLKPHLKP